MVHFDVPAGARIRLGAASQSLSVVEGKLAHGIRHMKDCHRLFGFYEIRTPDEQQVLQRKLCRVETSASATRLAYWMGRYWRIILPDWESQTPLITAKKRPVVVSVD